MRNLLFVTNLEGGLDSCHTRHLCLSNPELNHSQFPTADISFADMTH